MDKIIDGIIAAMIHELVDEFFRAHIQYHLIGLRNLFTSFPMAWARWVLPNPTPP